MRLPAVMRSLRARIALLLVGAILAVVALAAFVSIQMLERPDRASFHQTFAEEVRIVATILAEDPDAARRLDIKVGPEPREAPGLQVEEIDAGCCGMAGTFGHEKQNQEDSRGLYQMGWQQAVQEYGSSGVLVTGFSCRSQIKRIEKKRVRHPLEIILQSLS